jgi:glutamate dehydrogenase/leucine dehydrogenase
MPIEGCRVIIQGFGNVGSNAARLMMEHGYKIVGIAEKDGGLFNPNGIDIHQLVEYKYRNGKPSWASAAPRPCPAKSSSFRLRHPDSRGH